MNTRVSGAVMFGPIASCSSIASSCIPVYVDPVEEMRGAAGGESVEARHLVMQRGGGGEAGLSTAGYKGSIIRHGSLKLRLAWDSSLSSHSSPGG